MTLSALDWSIIAIYFAMSLAIGLYYCRRAGESTQDYFVAGRQHFTTHGPRNRHRFLRVDGAGDDDPGADDGHACAHECFGLE